MLFFLSCVNNTAPQSYIKTLHYLETHPLEWSQCLALAHKEDRQDCLLFAVSKNTSDVASQICLEMVEQRDECYFLLAEQTLNGDFCTQAQSYQTDCRIHLLVKQLANRKDYKTLLTELHLPADGIQGWTAIYRTQLQTLSPLDGTWCEAQDFPNFCLKAMEGLYWDRLNRYFKCTKIHSKLRVLNAPSLTKALNERQTKCSP